jgi:ankyrin repeat protein
MIDSDDFSSYNNSNDTMSISYMPSSRFVDGTLGTSLNNYKKKKSYDIDVQNNNNNKKNWEITRRDIQGRCLLHYFAFNGDIESAKELFISYSFPVDLYDESLNTALHVASENGQVNIAKLLLEQQALINRQNINGKTALHLAVESQQKEVVDILLSYGANPNIEDLQGASPLHLSSANASIEISQSLLRHGAFVNKKDFAKETPLFWAIRESKVDQVEMLIKNGANVNVKNDDGETPLDLAHEFDEDDILIFLQRSLNPSSNTYTYNISSFSTPSSSIILPNKSQPVNFVIPNKGSEQPIIENRPQSL